MRQIKENSATKNWLRGGQIVDHNIRMFKQTAKRVAFASLFLSIVYIAAYTTINISPNNRSLAFNYYHSYVMNSVASDEEVNTLNYNNQTIKIKHSQVIRSDVFIHAKNIFENVFISASIQALVLILLFYFFISIYIRKRGKEGQSDKFLRGGQIVENKIFTKILNKKQINKDLKLGVVPVLKNTETIHFEISGAPGTGKSQTLKHLIKDIKNRGERAVVYSSSTEFISDFYDKSKDIILNPLDDRSPKWSIWNEVQEVYHYDDIAASLIPEVEAGVNDPFWSDTARSLLSNTARKLKERGDYSTKILLDKLLSVSLKEIANLVKNTAAATIFADGAEKTALSVRSTLLSKLESFKFLTRSKGDFSIRDWVKNEKDNQGCVFISSIGDQHEVLKPLISCWVDIFASSILSLPEDESRRIWLIIDELPSLHKLKSLEKILAESRKYGGCVVLAYQSYSKIEAVYGDKGAKTLSDLTASKIFFRSNDKHNAQHASEQLGKEEIKITNENLSMGAHTARDAISISETEKLRELVIPTQILNLEELHGFYCLPGDYPVVSFKQELFKQVQERVDGFVASTKTDHIYMLEGSVDESDANPMDIDTELDQLGDLDLAEVPSHITEEIPLDSEQYSFDINKAETNNETKSQDKKQKQDLKPTDENLAKNPKGKKPSSIMLRGFD